MSHTHTSIFFCHKTIPPPLPRKGTRLRLFNLWINNPAAWNVYTLPAKSDSPVSQNITAGFRRIQRPKRANTIHNKKLKIANLCEHKYRPRKWQQLRDNTHTQKRRSKGVRALPPLLQKKMLLEKNPKKHAMNVGNKQTRESMLKTLTFFLGPLLPWPTSGRTRSAAWWYHLCSTRPPAKIVRAFIRGTTQDPANKKRKERGRGRGDQSNSWKHSSNTQHIKYRMTHNQRPHQIDAAVLPVASAKGCEGCKRYVLPATSSWQEACPLQTIAGIIPAYPF